MNILCGMIKQTNGSVEILNNDTRHNMNLLNKYISYCPQCIFSNNLKRKFIIIIFFKFI